MGKGIAFIIGACLLLMVLGVVVCQAGVITREDGCIVEQVSKTNNKGITGTYEVMLVESQEYKDAQALQAVKSKDEEEAREIETLIQKTLRDIAIDYLTVNNKIETVNDKLVKKGD